MPRIDHHIAAMLDALVPPDKRSHEGLVRTPDRVEASLRELTAGYHADPAAVLGTTFPADQYDEIVVVTGIDFWSLCEHHMLPFHGQAAVAYLPGDRIVGLSKLARIVDVYARRLQVQERMTREIADAIETVLRPRGCAVLVRASHLCMRARGVGKPHSVMTTSVLRGAFRDQAPMRAEVLKLLTAPGDGA